MYSRLALTYDIMTQFMNTSKSLTMALTIDQAQEDKFSIKWNDFTSNVNKSFRNLRNQEDFIDVTLVGDDSKHVVAHKLVLSTSSEYFRNIFSNNKKYFQSHALVCLAGLNYGDLSNILDFIYQGEVQIQHQDMDRFLKIAKRLKIYGLIEGDEQTDEDTSENILDEQIDEGTSENIFEDEILVTEKDLSKRDNMFTDPKETIENRMKLIQSSDLQSLEEQGKKGRIGTRKISIQVSDIKSLEELDQKVEDSYFKDYSNGFYKCYHCMKVSKNRGHMKEHVEFHFEGLSFPCSYCSSDLKSRSALRMHITKKHFSKVH